MAETGQTAAEVNAQIEQGPASPGSSHGDAGSYTSFQWLLAWVVLFVVLIFLARTRIGYLLIYYLLALSVVFLLVTQYKWFASVLAPFGSLKPGFVVAGATSGNQTPATGAVPGAASVIKEFGSPS